MAKKKAKKKVTKKAKKKAKKSSKPTTRKRAKPDPYKKLLAKIDRIKERVPYIEPTGECKDENTGEVLFRYTEAQHVFETYRAECDLERIHYRPYADANIHPIVVAVGNMPCLIGFFCIEDRETGARLVGWGSGMGRNLDWSGNTAGTRALKQFLLMTFEATWQDPENPTITRQQEKDLLRAEVIKELDADGTLANIEQVRFWATQFGKEKHGTGTGKTDTDRNSVSGSRKDNRTKAKRDDIRGKSTSRSNKR